MPNIKSQIDRVEQTKKETLRNKAIKNNMRTVIKKADAALTSGSADSDKLVNEALSAISKAESKGTLHKNNAARKMSQMMKKANAAKSE
jgi:small subunit ribosomal protein S20